MNVNQIYTLVNDVAKQTLGQQAVTATDISSLISLGNVVLSSTTSTDNFLKSLVDRIGKTIVSARSYRGKDDGIISDAFTWGAVLQKIYVKPQQAQKNDSWDITSTSATDPFVINKPDVVQYLFSGINTWEIPITIPTVQIHSAFTSPEAMAVFIDGIFTTIENSLAIQMEGISNMAYANFIGEKIVDVVKNQHNTAQVRNLLTEYKAIKGSVAPTTAADALQDSNFLKWASAEIRKTINRMATMSTLYNTEDFMRHTPKDYQRVTVLQDFASAMTTFAEADTFHNELIALPNYREVPYWQGSGTTYSFDDTSKVSIKTSSGNVVAQGGVVALVNDIEAIMLTNMNRRTTSIYNPRNETTNYFNKIDIGYANDLSENGVVFIIADALAEIS